MVVKLIVLWIFFFLQINKIRFLLFSYIYIYRLIIVRKYLKANFVSY